MGRGSPLLLRLVIAVLALWVLALPALAREEITSFDSATTLKTDGSVDVTETIAVTAEGNRIRHGIFRDVFTVLRNADGSKFYVDLGVVSVTLDGQRAPFTTEGIANGERIRIGDADTLVSPGPHTYVVRYTMSRMARFFPDHDELYWNVTGNFWDFPIAAATATVTLPKGAVIEKLAAYTGPVGATAGNATATRTADNVASFRTTRSLAPGDGLTVAIAFQKGIVAPAAGVGQGVNWLSDHRDPIVPAIAVLLVLLYNGFAWNAVGRDPKRGTIIPLFHPPEGFSPAMAQWVSRMGFKGSGWDAFTATIFDLGVKGLVTVDNSDKTLTVTATGAQPPTPLTADEQVLFDYFAQSGTVRVDKTTGPTLAGKRTALLAAVTGPNRGAWFNLNFGYVAVGAVLALACIGVMVWAGVLDPGWLIAAVVVGVALGIMVGVSRSGSGRTPFGFIFVLVWALLFGGNALFTVAGLATDSPINTPVVAAISIVVITGLFGFLMRAPTPAGRKLMDQLEGFKMYLNTAEKHRLNLEGEPPLTVKRFEAILPFAIALGVEKPWSDRFNAALAANAVPDATGTTYAPLWYSGGNFSSRGLAASIAAISTGMTAAMAASVPSSSSSSGFSGGSSGGGGGGGGGGGW